MARCAWIEVEDQGGPWTSPGHDDRPHGLDIVTALAGDGNWGIDGDEHAGIDPDPDLLTLDMPLRVRFHERDSVALPVFAPADSMAGATA